MGRWDGLWWWEFQERKCWVAVVFSGESSGELECLQGRKRLGNGGGGMLVCWVNLGDENGREFEAGTGWFRGRKKGKFY